jgi:small subunit ribosomal protein S16
VHRLLNKNLSCREATHSSKIDRIEADMVSIRLARGGSKKRPFYHLTVTDSRVSRDGRFLERVGFFNPIARGQEERVRIDQARVDFWLSKGAQPSERVAKLLKDQAKAIVAA